MNTSRYRVPHSAYVWVAIKRGGCGTQRGAREGWRPTRRRGTHPELAGCAREVQRRRAHCHRWSIHRDERARCGLLDHQGEVDGGGDRVVKRAPNVSPNGVAEVEIRRLMDIEDFGEGVHAEPGNREGEVQVEAARLPTTYFSLPARLKSEEKGLTIRGREERSTPQGRLENSVEIRRFPCCVSTMDDLGSRSRLSFGRDEESHPCCHPV